MADEIAPTFGSRTVVDRPIAVVSGVNATPVTYTVHVDHLNRPIKMTDAAKASVWDAVWAPWGNVYAITGAAVLDARLPGQWFQLESGLHYNWHRHYDPTLGRYTQPDPLGFVDGPSVYGYAGGSPLRHVDRDGRYFYVQPGQSLVPPSPSSKPQQCVADKCNDPSEARNPKCWGPEGAGGGGGPSRGGVGGPPPSRRLPDEALVCRGGTCSAERFENGSGVSRNSDGTLNGVSVSSAPGSSAAELSYTYNNGQIGVSTVGQVRAFGGEVIMSPTFNNPNHATINGLTASQLERIFTPTIRNPNK